MNVATTAGSRATVSRLRAALDPRGGDDPPPEPFLHHQPPRRGETIVKNLKTLVGALAGAALLGSALAVQPAFGADIVLRMAVPDWPPTRTMKDLADKHYKAPSGNNVVLEPDFIPWPDYYTRLAASLTSGEQKYQMAVSRQPMARRQHRGRLLHEAQRLHRRRPRAPGGVQGPPSHPGLRLLHLSAHRRGGARGGRLPPIRTPTTTASRRCRTSSSSTTARTSSATRVNGPHTRRSTATTSRAPPRT